MSWQAYCGLEPIGDERLDWLVASIVQMIHNVAVGKDHQKALKEFLLDFTPQEAKKPQSVEDQIWVAKMWVDAFGDANEDLPKN